MIKVKEYLDKHFYSAEPSIAVLKENGHYNVQGHWSIPHEINWKKSFIRCNCNNETLQFIIIDNGKSVGYYGYLQTYEHIPRGLPDSHGYYARSTEDEIIKYIETFYIRVGWKKEKQL